LREFSAAPHQIAPPTLSILEDNQKRKVGRPFKGQVEEFTKEPFVPERRSILRGFKKFYSKKEFENIRGILDGRITLAHVYGLSL
jgi:hypothetical protein